MNDLLFKIYELVPAKLRKTLTQTGIFNPLKRFVAGSSRGLRHVTVDVLWNGAVKFKFHAPIKIADKAKNRGIENTLLRNSLRLLGNTKNANVLDVGCNYGFLSSVWALSHQVATVHAFEPHAEICNSVRKTIQMNGLDNKLFLHQKAVGSMNKTVDMFFYRTSSNAQVVGNAEPERHPVQQVTLDSFCAENGIVRCDLIKIDIDGLELEVLKGAENIIRNCRPVIVVETNDNPKLLELLTAYGYSLLDMKLMPVEAEMPPNLFAIPSR